MVDLAAFTAHAWSSFCHCFASGYSTCIVSPRIKTIPSSCFSTPSSCAEKSTVLMCISKLLSIPRKRRPFLSSTTTCLSRLLLSASKGLEGSMLCRELRVVYKVYCLCGQRGFINKP